VTATMTDEVRQVVAAGRLAHMVTLDADGSPQVSLVWVGLDGDQIISGHLELRRKVQNVQRDPRIALSIEAEGRTEQGLGHYLVVHGRAEVVSGGAAPLLQRLAEFYLGPGARFLPDADPAVGYVVRITPERIGGVGPWSR
jgi:PPOX class probable F420-dependent enzyme